MIRLTKTNTSLVALVFLAGCASLRSTSSNRLDQSIAQADSGYRQLDADHAVAYNNAVTSIARTIDGETPNELRGQLEPLGVKLDQPKITLPLARYHVVPRSRTPNDSSGIGAPMLLEYDTTNAPLYPREGLMISATAVYRRVEGERHLSLLTGKNRLALNGSTYPLKIDNVAPITAMAKRGRHVARAGLSQMLHPAAMRVKTGIYLTEPYDPNKIPVLMVHGLQSTPFAFVSLIDAIRRDPMLSERYQIWTFLYGTGTPVLFNALELRRELDTTIRALDPNDHDFATRHIVVLGHSMGGLLAHTLVSASREKLWNAIFTVPPQQLRGDAAMVSRIADGLHFRRNTRVVRAIFAATPHRGSKIAESWIGHIGASLICLPSSLHSDIVDVLSANRESSTAVAQTFNREMNFSAVHTLSPRDPALKALVDLPIEVPFHSIIGQHTGGALETSSDGVVAYTSSHIDGAASELVVHSGHGVCETPDGQNEIIRILRLELTRNADVARR
ncbi:MAG TPA: alpha/beta hydrolase [Chthoniobacterales bacterium]|nr:alpha/beta hydrolase [Chthoniobacterales bacterium]